MTIFKYEQIISNSVEDRLDLELLMFGPVSQYFNTEILQRDLQRLENLGYRMLHLHCQNWGTLEVTYQAICSLLELPQCYGLDTLYSLLRDREITEETGICLVLNRFDSFAKQSFPAAKQLLDVLVSCSHYHQLFGRTILILIQSDDPSLHFESVADITVYWNPQEFLNSKRGV